MGALTFLEPFGVEVAVDARPPGERWATSGLMALTGRPDRPPLPGPAAVADRLAELAAAVASLSGVVLDGPGLASERAAIGGFRRRGRVSIGGACHLVRAVDGWLAVNLARDSDVDLLPAWLEIDDADRWEDAVGTRSAVELDERAGLLGLPATMPRTVTARPVVRRPAAEWQPGPSRSAAGLRVVDLGAMWAGPLCASILRMAGAEVIKVEDPRRPDGGRLGPPAFYDLLNGGHRSVALDIRSPALVDLLRSADVVIESARPRVFPQLGIDREAIAAETGCVWVVITGYGLDDPRRDRPAFGDDAAVAGGLVAIDPDDGGPLFCADAIADPVTGLTAAAGALAALRAGGPWLVDAGLAACAAALADPPLDADLALEPADPRALRVAPCAAAGLGADTDEIVGHRAA